jgi:hypothetical protein
MGKTKSVVIMVLVSVFWPSLQSCDWLGKSALGEAIELYHKAPDLTLAWDPPVTDVPKTPLEVVSYQIYYRQHGAPLWCLLDEISASASPEFTIAMGRLQDGAYDFAVSAVLANGRVSPLHSSLDNSADPVSGWFVLWVRSD